MEGRNRNSAIASSLRSRQSLISGFCDARSLVRAGLLAYTLAHTAVGAEVVVKKAPDSIMHTPSEAILSACNLTVPGRDETHGESGLKATDVGCHGIVRQLGFNVYQNDDLTFVASHVGLAGTGVHIDAEQGNEVIASMRADGVISLANTLFNKESFWSTRHTDRLIIFEGFGGSLFFDRKRRAFCTFRVPLWPELNPLRDYYVLDDGSLVFVDWDKYNSSTVKRRVSSTTIDEICPSA
ncbi:hypothetical protein [Paraburkholderia sp. SIMBA_054]|uniref:hypothetical protein n=1 Tax=Paraburkholderia sp. SIMBA_054 TaxID=3085795 RepID=UPI00397E3CBE